jgi:dTDP-4-amino-4,6-dideoxygalactose transaminase
MLDSGLSPWPVYSSAEIEAVARTLASGRVNYWTGQECRHFEREFAGWAGVAHGVALANGTLALDLALRGLGIGPGDEVVVTPRTFLASVSTVVNAGATPVFADVELNGGNLHADAVAAVLTPRTRAVLCVHLGGWPCDMDALGDLTRSHGIHLIEDCAQAHGARWRGRSVGSFGAVAAWSFCQDKILSTGGEGGMVTTNDPHLWSSMWSYKDHGKSWEAVYERQHPPGFRWLHDSFGTNWRMLEIQAVIGRLQLARLPEWTRRRSWAARHLIETAQGIAALRVPGLPKVAEHAWYRVYFYVRPEALAAGWSRDRIVEAIKAEGIPAFQGSCSEVYLERAFDGTPWRPAHRLPNARVLGETSLALLVHPSLTDREIERTAQVLSQVMTQASR